MGKVSTDNVNAMIRTVINVSFNILILAVVAMLIYNCSGKAYEFGEAIFKDEAIVTDGEGQVVVITIPKNASSGKVAEVVYEEGLVENQYVFLIQLVLSEYKDTIVPGTYRVTTANTPTEIMQILSDEVQEEDSENDN